MSNQLSPRCKSRSISSLLASTSWGIQTHRKLLMGSPWDDGVVVCYEHGLQPERAL